MHAKQTGEQIMLKKILAIVILAASLSACGAISKKDTPITTTVPVLFPKYLVENCYVPTPPDKDTYLNATYEQREDIWANSLLDQYKAARTCNIKIETLRKWREEQIKIYKIKE